MYRLFFFYFPVKVSLQAAIKERHSEDASGRASAQLGENGEGREKEEGVFLKRNPASSGWAPPSFLPLSIVGIIWFSATHSASSAALPLN